MPKCFLAYTRVFFDTQYTYTSCSDLAIAERRCESFLVPCNEETAAVATGCRSCSR
jgi:hypothetical protein